MRLKNRFLTALAVFMALGLGLASAAKADTITIVGNANSTQSTATLTTSISSPVNNISTLTFSLKNTSPGSSTITAVGFDLIANDFSGNNSAGLNGFTGTQSGAGAFTFSDDSIGNVPQFNNAVLDFGFTSGPSGNFNGQVANGITSGQTATFTVTGNFQGLSLTAISNAIYVRFQETPVVGSDVGRPNGSPVPEPATMLLLGTGLAGIGGAIRRRRNSAN